MDPAQRIAVLGAGVFFLTGLLAGVWKYVAIAQSPAAQAPVYVDITHRAALLYAFACLVIERFVSLSQLDPTLELWAVIAQLSFFALAVATYVVHGLLRDTDNQLARPHRLGRGTLSPGLITAFMVALIGAEVGGFAILFYGALRAM